MNRQEAIEILKEYKKWELDCNHCKSDLHTAIHYSLNEVAKAIDTLTAPISITDEIVFALSAEYQNQLRNNIHSFNAMKAALAAALGGDDVKSCL
jgi:hypothetical protein